MVTKKVGAEKKISTTREKPNQTAKKASNVHENGDPKFPYTTEPKALGRLLAEIPKRPKPPKVMFETLQSWNVSNNTNARSAINVLKKIGLLGPSAEPLDSYVRFMQGPTELAERIRETYKIFFENNHAPQNESPDELRKLFNIHSGGGEEAIRLQLQTFKALSEHADFESAIDSQAGNETQKDVKGKLRGSMSQTPLPPVQIDLHIHLPENKTTRDYEAIIQDIAKYIYGRDVERN